MYDIISDTKIVGVYSNIIPMLSVYDTVFVSVNRRGLLVKKILTSKVLRKKVLFLNDSVTKLLRKRYS